MKTSNKLLLTTILIIIVSMVTYDFALRAEYKKGEYKNRFYGMQKVSALTGYTAIDNRAANFAAVDIEQGKNQEIWTRPNWKDDYKIYKSGTTLVIEVIPEKVKNIKPYHQINITVICPLIEKITTKRYTIPKSSENDYDSDGTTTLKGFDLQNLSLNIGKSSNIILEKNKIEHLQAKIGANLSQNSNLTIRSNNQINLATINVFGKNGLHIDNPIIGKKQFTISDSATISLSGSIHNQIIK